MITLHKATIDPPRKREQNSLFTAHNGLRQLRSDFTAEGSEVKVKLCRKPLWLERRNVAVRRSALGR